MAKTISQAQLHFLETGQLDLMGEKDLKPITLTDLSSTLAYLGALYAQKLVENLNKVDASSSGELSDSITSLDVTVFGSVYTVSIQAAKYAKFIDEGVDGWAKSRGSKYKFKTKGVDPDGDMVKSIKAWLIREGGMVRNNKKATTKREGQQMSITDRSTRQAITTAYMIKRMGIKPTKFWQNTTKQMRAIVEQELAKALKVDIINAIIQ